MTKGLEIGNVKAQIAKPLMRLIGIQEIKLFENVTIYKDIYSDGEILTVKFRVLTYTQRGELEELLYTESTLYNLMTTLTAEILIVGVKP